MKFLATGGDSFIGSAVIRHLIQHIPRGVGNLSISINWQVGTPILLPRDVEAKNSTQAEIFTDQLMGITCG